jgi:hypothetical protein
MIADSIVRTKVTKIIFLFLTLRKPRGLTPGLKERPENGTHPALLLQTGSSPVQARRVYFH